MRAIYNIYFKCETFWQKPSYCTKQPSILSSLWQLSPLVPAPPPRALSRLEGAPQLAEPRPVLELTLLPGAFSLLPFLDGPGSAGSLSRPAPGPASVSFFHEILGQENLPILVWQAWDHYHFRAGRKLRVLSSAPLLLETRILRRRDVKGLGGITWVIYDKARTWIQLAIFLSQFKGFRREMDGYTRLYGGHFCLAVVFVGLFVLLCHFPLE